MPSFNPDRDENPHNIISEASTSSIETISTVLIKEPEETITKTEEPKSSNNNGMSRQILRVDNFTN